MRSEDAPRTVGGRFRYRISLPYHRSLFFAPRAYSVPEKALSGTEFFKLPEKGEHYLHRRQQTPERKRPFPVQCSEDAPRTVGGRFRYRISLPYRRSLFFTPSASENASRTTEACLSHRAHIPYQRRPSPVPNFPLSTRPIF